MQELVHPAKSFCGVSKYFHGIRIVMQQSKYPSESSICFSSIRILTSDSQKCNPKNAEFVEFAEYITGIQFFHINIKLQTEAGINYIYKIRKQAKNNVQELTHSLSLLLT